METTIVDGEIVVHSSPKGILRLLHEPETFTRAERIETEKNFFGYVDYQEAEFYVKQDEIPPLQLLHYLFHPDLHYEADEQKARETFSINDDTILSFTDEQQERWENVYKAIKAETALQVEYYYPKKDYTTFDYMEVMESIWEDAAKEYERIKNERLEE